MRIGLLPRSFVPDVIIPELRKLTRQQKHYNIGTFLISLLRQSKKMLISLKYLMNGMNLWNCNEQGITHKKLAVSFHNPRLSVMNLAGNQA